MKGIDSQKKYWDSVSSSKVFTHPLDIGRLCRLVPRRERILDFGCGYGRTCDELYRHGYWNVVGIDVSDGMIRRGREAYPHLCLETLPAGKLPFAPETMGAVLLLAVLTCIPSHEGQRAIIADVFRVLRPGGIIYISDYWLQDDRRNRDRYRVFQDKYGVYGVFELSEGAVVRHHRRDWIATLLAGFETDSLYDIQVTTMNGHVSSGFQYLGRKPGGLSRNFFL